MDLTTELKNEIDDLDYFHLLRRWRYGPLGDPMFQGETGDYWLARMNHLKSQPDGHERAVAASKMLG